MVFTSYAFLFWFLPCFLGVYFALPRTVRNLWLLCASVVFYGWERPEWVLIMGASTVVDYVAARAMGPADERRRGRKALLVVSLCANLGLLAYFKYANLFVHSAEELAGARWNWTDVVLPVGISFYTFQSMSYTIDVYRGHVSPTRSFVDFACFVTMFPQLVAGPIVRYADVHREVVGRAHSLHGFATGVHVFAMGFVKKVLVADAVAPLTVAAFALHEPGDGFAPGLLQAWTGLFAYSVQIYFDFSGYSDMAVGLGLMLGFHFPQNFDSPYRSASITEAWRRWHISLSTWLRDYLYVPLGGNRKGELRTYANLMATMLLGGLWHGANWPFVCWGAYQGLLLCVERRNRRRPLYAALPRPLRVLLTYLLFTFGWSMFVAVDFAHLWELWKGLFGVHGLGGPLAVGAETGRAYLLLALGLGIALLAPNSWQLLRRFHPLVVAGTFALFLLALVHALAVDHVPFLYFQF